MKNLFFSLSLCLSMAAMTSCGDGGKAAPEVVPIYPVKQGDGAATKNESKESNESKTVKKQTSTTSVTSHK